MKYKHYAPKAQITIIEGNKESVVKYINEEISKKLTGNV